jgi:hypothetical protein
MATLTQRVAASLTRQALATAVWAAKLSRAGARLTVAALVSAETFFAVVA